jgi:hypothetical protein
MRHHSNSALPSTLSGIKRLAKAIGRQDEIPHTQALDRVAQICGYQNFHHARRALERVSANDQSLRSSFSIYLSAYWRDASTKPMTAGLETLQIELPNPLLSILQRHQCGSARNLEAFFIEFDDHLEMRPNVDSQARARELLYRAALTLQFMEATGMRPATTRVQRKKMQVVEDLPQHDHMSRWLSPSGQWVVLDEPYDHVTKPDVVEHRCAWLERNGLHLLRPAWGGLYVPGEAVPHLISTDKELLEEVVTVIESMPKLIPQSLDDWQGSTDDYRLQFVSPARQAAGIKRKPRPGTTYGWSKNAIQYTQRPGFKPNWRPDQAMSLSNHVELGETLQRLNASGIPYATYEKIGVIRSELEDWMYAENSRYSRKPTRDEGDAYYSGNDFAQFETAEDQLAAIDRVQLLLVGSYLDCVPLRNMLKRLAAARAVLVADMGARSAIA